MTHLTEKLYIINVMKESIHKLWHKRNFIIYLKYHKTSGFRVKQSLYSIYQKITFPECPNFDILWVTCWQQLSIPLPAKEDNSAYNLCFNGANKTPKAAI